MRDERARERLALARMYAPIRTRRAGSRLVSFGRLPAALRLGRGRRFHEACDFDLLTIDC